MSELDQLEAMLRARPSILTIDQRRSACDALADRYPTAADVQVTPVIANGIPAEWTSTPAARDDVSPEGVAAAAVALGASGGRVR